MNDLPVTVFMTDNINKIKNIDALGVYAYLLSEIQFKGLAITKKHLIRLTKMQFNCSEEKASSLIDYLLDLKVGIEDYITCK